MQYQFSPSELDYLPAKCVRCYYLLKVNKIKNENFPPPVFSNFDVIQQAYFKNMNTNELTDQLPSGRIMQKNEIPGKIVSTTLKDNKGREFLLGGRPDIVAAFDDGSFGIIDFKTTNIKEQKAENYRYQLEAYKQIFTNPGAIKKGPTPKLEPITKMGVLQFEPNKIISHNNEGAQINLEMSYSKLEMDESKFYKKITSIIDFLAQSTPPEFNDKCSDCMFVLKQKDI